MKTKQISTLKSNLKNIYVCSFCDLSRFSDTFKTTVTIITTTFVKRFITFNKMNSI